MGLLTQNEAQINGHGGQQDAWTLQHTQVMSETSPRARLTRWDNAPLTPNNYYYCVILFVFQKAFVPYVEQRS